MLLLLCFFYVPRHQKRQVKSWFGKVLNIEKSVQAGLYDKGVRDAGYQTIFITLVS